MSLSADLAKLLRQDFAVLKAPGLAERTLNYALLGIGPEVLAELSESQTAGQELRLLQVIGGDHEAPIPPRIKFFKKLSADPDIPLLARLTEIYEAAANKRTRALPKYCLLPDGAKWLETLMRDLAYQQYPPRAPVSPMSLKVLGEILRQRGQPESLMALVFVSGFRATGPATLYTYAKRFPDTPAYLRANLDTLRQEVLNGDATLQLHILNLLTLSKGVEDTFSALGPVVVPLLWETNLRVWDRANRIASKIPAPELIAAVEGALPQCDGSQRFLAAIFLVTRFGESPQAKAVLERLAAKERGSKLKRFLQNHLGTSGDGG